MAPTRGKRSRTTGAQREVPPEWLEGEPQARRSRSTRATRGEATSSSTTSGSNMPSSSARTRPFVRFALTSSAETLDDPRPSDSPSSANSRRHSFPTSPAVDDDSIASVLGSDTTPRLSPSPPLESPEGAVDVVASSGRPRRAATQRAMELILNQSRTARPTRAAAVRGMEATNRELATGRAQTRRGASPPVTRRNASIRAHIMANIGDRNRDPLQDSSDQDLDSDSDDDRMRYEEDERGVGRIARTEEELADMIRRERPVGTPYIYSASIDQDMVTTVQVDLHMMERGRRITIGHHDPSMEPRTAAQQARTVQRLTNVRVEDLDEAEVCRVFLRLIRYAEEMMASEVGRTIVQQRQEDEQARGVARPVGRRSAADSAADAADEEEERERREEEELRREEDEMSAELEERRERTKRIAREGAEEIRQLERAYRENRIPEANQRDEASEEEKEARNRRRLAALEKAERWVEAARAARNAPAAAPAAAAAAAATPAAPAAPPPPVTPPTHAGPAVRESRATRAAARNAAAAAGSSRSVPRGLVAMSTMDFGFGGDREGQRRRIDQLFNDIVNPHLSLRSRSLRVSRGTQSTLDTQTRSQSQGSSEDQGTSGTQSANEAQTAQAGTSSGAVTREHFHSMFMLARIREKIVQELTMIKEEWSGQSGNQQARWGQNREMENTARRADELSKTSVYVDRHRGVIYGPRTIVHRGLTVQEIRAGPMGIIYGMGRTIDRPFEPGEKVEQYPPRTEPVSETERLNKVIDFEVAAQLAAEDARNTPERIRRPRIVGLLNYLNMADDSPPGSAARTRDYRLQDIISAVEDCLIAYRDGYYYSDQHDTLMTLLKRTVRNVDDIDSPAYRRAVYTFRMRPGVGVMGNVFNDIFAMDAGGDQNEKQRREEEDREEQLATAVKSSEWGECRICMADEPINPVGCKFCRQLVGCKKCCSRWYRAGRRPNPTIFDNIIATFRSERDRWARPETNPPSAGATGGGDAPAAAAASTSAARRPRGGYVAAAVAAARGSAGTTGGGDAEAAGRSIRGDAAAAASSSAATAADSASTSRDRRNEELAEIEAIMQMDGIIGLDEGIEREDAFDQAASTLSSGGAWESNCPLCRKTWKKEPQVVPMQRCRPLGEPLEGEEE